jgi:hypothetical protein
VNLKRLAAALLAVFIASFFNSPYLHQITVPCVVFR